MKNDFISLSRFIKYYIQIYGKPRLTGQHLKIQFGCGANLFSGWINTDLFTAKADFHVEPNYYLDVSRELPIDDASAQFLYSEHLIEHLPLETAVKFFKESFRVLESGGVMRCATPDLGYLTKKYFSLRWKNQNWLTWPEYKFIKTPAEMLNIAMRWWGHQYLFGENELKRRLKEAGFKKIKRQTWQKSHYKQLRKLETRRDSKLIIEAIKD